PWKRYRFRAGYGIFHHRRTSGRNSVTQPHRFRAATRHAFLHPPATANSNNNALARGSQIIKRASMSHILIVEDETVIRSALKRLLERNGYQVSEAGSVQEAQEQLQQHSFSLIISDLRLPGAPGTEMIALAGTTPVLIMTSYASLRSAVDSMKLGAIDYIA